MLILGSTSPRRKELLESAGFKFKVVSPVFDESSIAYQGNPVDYVSTLALKKAESLKQMYPGDVILTADTIVVLDNEVLGKPLDHNDAKSMLKKLSNNLHQVYTAVSIIINDVTEVFVDVASVEFNKISDLDIESYILTNEPMDKAGAYAIQGGGAKFILGYQGDFHTIMGLPLKKVIETLKKYQIDPVV